MDEERVWAELDRLSGADEGVEAKLKPVAGKDSALLVLCLAEDDELDDREEINESRLFGLDARFALPAGGPCFAPGPEAREQKLALPLAPALSVRGRGADGNTSGRADAAIRADVLATGSRATRGLPARPEKKEFE